MQKQYHIKLSQVHLLRNSSLNIKIANIKVVDSKIIDQVF